MSQDKNVNNDLKWDSGTFIIMKNFIVIALLSTLSVCLGAVVQNAQFPINVGVLEPGDWVMISGVNRSNPQPNFVSQVTVRHQLHPNYKVNMVKFIDRAPETGGFISFVGGIGTNFVTFVLTSQRGGGYHYSYQLWGHDTTGADVRHSLESAECTMTVDDGKTVKTYNCNEIVH
ncbi:uncharacterized protein LOC124630743 [Helicoverpa zea]|uniref:uncharacterized protein LOC124630743 n=1 Tax=Helicoverpa zea TaxID=7113 RepID=UPI001F5914F2|nr:uncharacterized protein LOC124630743 [Helicoverpa zea]